jgi:hypothetical protein
MTLFLYLRRKVSSTSNVAASDNVVIFMVQFYVSSYVTFAIYFAAEIAFLKIKIIVYYFQYMFRLFSLCTEDFNALTIVLAHNEQTCMFFVHVIHHFSADGVGTFAKHALVPLFRTFEIDISILLVSGITLFVKILLLSVMFFVVI